MKIRDRFIQQYTIADSLRPTV